MRKIIASVSLIVALMIAVVLPSAGCSEKETLTIYHAGSLTKPFIDLEAEFEETHPDVDVLRESGGSNLMISKSIANEEAGESPPDIIASADYTLISDRLVEGGYAEWYIAFAKNKMVLCYRDGAPGAEAIVNDSRSWYDVLRNDSVSYGHSDPDDDPCGYRTLLVMQLAEEFYYEDAEPFGNTPDENAKGLYDALIPGSEYERGRASQRRETVMSKSVDLVIRLEAGELDYAFEYRSVAVQHNLNFIELDDAINLSGIGDIGVSGITYSDFYKRASIEIVDKPGPPPTYKEQTGKPIVYGITIPAKAKNKALAIEFIKFLLSDTGRNIMEVKNGQPFIEPFLCDHPEKLPVSLRELISQ